MTGKEFKGRCEKCIYGYHHDRVVDGIEEGEVEFNGHICSTQRKIKRTIHNCLCCDVSDGAPILYDDNDKNVPECREFEEEEQ